MGVKVLVSGLKVDGTNTPFTYKLGTSPATGAGTVKLGVLLPVVLSVLLVPVSVTAVISGAAGAAGASVSTIKVTVLFASKPSALLLSATSVNLLLATDKLTVPSAAFAAV